MEKEIRFENSPDINGIMKAMCELLSKQSGGAFEYTYSFGGAESEKSTGGKSQRLQKRKQKAE